MPLFDDARAAWGAVKPTATNPVPIGNRTEFYNHWAGLATGLRATDPHSKCLAMVKRWQAEHMAKTPDHGWSDIGYNGLICVHARAIEGRGIYVSGAHCPNHNTSGLGWVFMVGKGDPAPTAAMQARMRRAYDDCSRLAGHALAKRGHRDGFATECPGNQIYAWITAGMPASATPVQEDDMSAQDVKEINDYTQRTAAETQRRLAVIAGLLDPAKQAAAIAAGIKAAGVNVDVNSLAKAIVVELGKGT